MKRKAKKMSQQIAAPSPLAPALRNRVLTDALDGIGGQRKVVIDLANLTDEPNKALLATMRRAIYALLLSHDRNLAYVEKQLKAILDRETVAPADGYYGDEMKLVML